MRNEKSSKNAGIILPIAIRLRAFLRDLAHLARKRGGCHGVADAAINKWQCGEIEVPAYARPARQVSPAGLLICHDDVL